ncbi:MAG: right-handed parallel beta-helix repeat-containing protein, partial [Candidatus Bipolaricaulota bacterium]|nr:right-handed parallel beta-helix repeat-containing protein [Candidatus Bipolaricaulota bacterium]
SGAMSTWVARALTIGSNGCTDVTITGNTVYNTRNGIVVQYSNAVALTENTIYATKGGIMNYTNTLADASNRTMTDNSWGTAHNEWDIVWNSANYDPDYHESVIELSASNEGAYVVDRRDAPGGNALGNRSHIFVSPTGTTTVTEVNGNMNAPYTTLSNGLGAVAAGGTVFVAAGGYQGVAIAKQVHIDGDDAGGAVITSGVGYSPTNSTYKAAFRLDAGADGTVIDDVTVLCTSATLYYFAVFSRNVDNVVLDNLVVYDTVQGISNWGGDGWQILGNEIIGTVAAGGGGIGFYLGVRPGTNLTCSGNLLQGNVVGSDATAPDYSCPGIVLALDLRYGAYGSLTGNEELSGNRILGNTITDGGVVNGVGIEMGVIMTGIADALVPDLIHDTLGMIHGNTIAGNTVSGEYLGVYLYTVADTDVNLNVISDCTGAGIAMYDGNVGNVFRYNSISGNAYGLWNETGSLVDAALNWWGDLTGPSDQGLGLGDAVSGDVIYSPWLALDPDGDPSTPGVQVTAPMLIVVAPVGPEPTGGYLNAAIVGSNSAELPYADTIYVYHGSYDGSESITQPVTIVSEPGSASRRRRLGPHQLVRPLRDGDKQRRRHAGRPVQLLGNPGGDRHRRPHLRGH